jgi:uncharacterized membrane-anchored protein YitT (DUF2179 family)
VASKAGIQAGKPHVVAMMMDKRDRWSSGTVQFLFSVLTHVVAIYSLIFPFKHEETVNTVYS